METNWYPDAKRPTVYQEGLEFQDFVVEQLQPYGIHPVVFSSRKYQFDRGESIQGIEIKLDRRCTETERLSIEVSEKSKRSNDTYYRSGILREDNTWLYIQGNFELFFVFAKKHLISAYQTGKYPVYEQATIRTFFLPFPNAEKIAILIIRPQGDAK